MGCFSSKGKDVSDARPYSDVSDVPIIMFQNNPRYQRPKRGKFEKYNKPSTYKSSGGGGNRGRTKEQVEIICKL